MSIDEVMVEFQKWWLALQQNSGARAELRRCSMPVEAAIQPATYSLKWALPPWVSMECISTLAGVASHIKQNGVDGFVTSLGKVKEGGSKPQLSEMRFRQLMKSRDWEELYKNLRRSVTIVDGVVNLDSFCKLVLDWDVEFKNQFTKPGKTVKYQMAEEYYKEVQ